MSIQMPDRHRTADRSEHEPIRAQVELAMARQRELNDLERAERRSLKLARRSSASTPARGAALAG